MKDIKYVICDWGGVVESHNDIYSVFQASINQIKLYTKDYTDDEILKKLNECSLNKNGKKLVS